jgi:hypothetical protein
LILFFVNLWSWKCKRHKHLMVLAESNHLITRLPPTTPVKMMTVNMPVIFPFYSFLEGYGSKPVYNAARLKHGFVNPMAIDFVFVTPDVHVRTIEAIDEANSGPQWLSDHDPVGMACTIPVA